MKKLMMGFLMMSFLIGVPVKKAEAGWAMGVVGTLGGSQVDADNLLGWGALALGGFTAIGTGIWVIRATHNGWGTAAGVVMIVLDTDSSLSQNVLENALTNAYPFLDNQMVIENLAKTIKAKAPREIKPDQKYLVSLTEAETLSNLNGADLTQEQIDLIVNDLK